MFSFYIFLSVVLHNSHPKLSFVISTRWLCLRSSMNVVLLQPPACVLLWRCVGRALGLTRPTAAPFPPNVNHISIKLCNLQQETLQGSARTLPWGRVTGSPRKAADSHAVTFQPHFAKSWGAQDNYLSGSCAAPRLHTSVSNTACDRPAGSK